MYVILMGPQGSGKGTQAARIAPQLGLVKIATGDLFRAAIAEHSDLGKRIQEIYGRGELVSDEITNALVEERLNALSTKRAAGDSVRGALFDGFPRNRAQAEALDTILADLGESVTAVLELQVPFDDLVTRLSNRRVCVNGDAVYNLLSNPPQREGTCDLCGGDVIQRQDDTEDAIRRRLSLYSEQTAPLLSYYAERSLVYEIDGDRPIDEVTASILDTLAAVGSTSSS